MVAAPARSGRDPRPSIPGGVGDSADVRRITARRLGARVTALLGAAGLLVGGLGAAAAPALGAGAGPSPAPLPSVTVPGGTTPVPVPPIPAVPPDVTAGQDPAALLQRAIALSSISASQAPLQAQLSADQQVLDAQSVLAAQADTAAAAAQAAATGAAAAAATASAAAASLQQALGAAVLQMYVGGTAGVAQPSVASADQLADAAAYEDDLLSPDGILAARRAEAHAARAALADRQAALAAARRDQQAADAAKASAAAATAALRRQLSGLQAGQAQLVADERTALSTQAGQSLTSPGALQFTPAAPLPSPLPTTSVALAWAFSELGKPYLWGGTGPDAFDCSGLTQYSWRAAGVAIPRVSEAQYPWTVPVPLSELLPGDLVFFGSSDIHHVGMYIGDGLMINAPHTGDVVRVSPIWWTDLAGFGRVHDDGVPVPARAVPAPTAAPVPNVVPTPGTVPSETAPPPGYVAPPGATAPVGVPSTTPSDGSTTTTTAPGATTTTPPTSPPPTTGPPSGTATTLPPTTLVPTSTGPPGA